MDEASLQIVIQLILSAGLALLMTIIHGLGLLAISKFLHLRKDRLEQRDFDTKALMLLGTAGMSVFGLHMLEIFAFAVFYLVSGAISSVEEALYYSASAYATLGRPADYFAQEWRLIGALEALIGFILIGWSTAFIVTTMDRLRRSPD